LNSEFELGCGILTLCFVNVIMLLYNL